MNKKELQVALKTGLVYLLISALWIIFSDMIVNLLFDDISTIKQFQLYKGLIFVLLTAVLLFLYVRRQTSELMYQFKFFESIFDQASIVLLALDRTGTIVKANLSAIGLFQDKHITGHSILDYLPQSQHREFLNTLNSVYGKTVVFERDTQLLKSSKSYFNAKISLFSELENDRLDGHILAIITPISPDSHYKAFADIMLQIIQGIPSDANERQIYEQVLHELCRGLNWDIGEIWHHDLESDTMRLTTQWYDLTQVESVRFAKESAKFPIPFGKGLVGSTYSQKTARWYNNLPENSEFLRADLAKRANLSVAVGLPLIIDEEPVAVLLLLRKSPVESDRILLQFLIGVMTELALKIKTNREFIMRKELESSLLFMMESVNIALWEMDVVSGIHKRFYSYIDENGQAILKHVEVPADEANQYIHPDDRKRFFSALDSAVLSQKPFSLEYRNVIGGKTSWMWTRGQVTYKAGKPKLISGIRLDITDRKLMEKDLEDSEYKYRSLFNDNPLPLAIYNLRDFKVYEANHAALSFYGYKPDELRSIKLTDLATEIDAEVMKERQSKVHSDGYVSWETRHRLKSGEFREVLIAARKIEYQGSKEAAIATILDVTEKKKAERNVLVSTIQGEENERKRIAKDLHDGLGQLLAAASLNVAGVKDEVHEPSEKALDYLEQAQRALNQAIVETRAISHNLMPKTIEDFGLSVSIESLVNMVKKAHPSIDIIYYSNVDKALKFAPILEVNLYRIVQECFNNTIKHAFASKIELQLVGHEHEVVFTYSDNGHGFDYDEKKSPLNGIGLMNIKNRVDSLNGELTLESRVGKGTHYTISLPLSP